MSIRLWRVVLFASLLFQGGCFSFEMDEEPLSRLYLGRYAVGDYDVDWYFHSGLGLLTEPVVVFRHGGETSEDTLVVSSQLSDIVAKGDSLIVYSCEPVSLRAPDSLLVRLVVFEETPCRGRRDQSPGEQGTTRPLAPEAVDTKPTAGP